MNIHRSKSALNSLGPMFFVEHLNSNSSHMESILQHTPYFKIFMNVTPLKLYLNPKSHIISKLNILEKLWLHNNRDGTRPFWLAQAMRSITTYFKRNAYEFEVWGSHSYEKFSVLRYKAVEANQRFRRTHHHHLRGQQVNHTRNLQEVCSKQSLAYSSTLKSEVICIYKNICCLSPLIHHVDYKRNLNTLHVSRIFS